MSVLKIFQFTLLKCSINTYLISIPWEYYAHFAGTLCSAKPPLWVYNNTGKETLMPFLTLHSRSQLFTKNPLLQWPASFVLLFAAFMRQWFLSPTFQKHLFTFYLLLYTRKASVVLNWKVILIPGEVFFDPGKKISFLQVWFHPFIFCFRESKMLSSERLGEKTW